MFGTGKRNFKSADSYLYVRDSLKQNPLVVVFRRISVWMAVAVKITDVQKWKQMWYPTQVDLQE